MTREGSSPTEVQRVSYRVAGAAEILAMASATGRLIPARLPRRPVIGRVVSALHALVAEIATSEGELDEQRAVAEKARLKFVEARQRLDSANSRVGNTESRLRATRAALDLIAERDGVAIDVIDTLLDNARRPA